MMLESNGQNQEMSERIYRIFILVVTDNKEILREDIQIRIIITTITTTNVS